MAVKPIYDLPLHEGGTKAYKTTHDAEMNRVIGGVWGEIQGLADNVGKIFESRDAARDVGQAKLPNSYGRIITIEGQVWVLRDPGATEDALFTEYPTWGIIHKLDLPALIAELQALESAGGTIFISTSQAQTEIAKMSAAPTIFFIRAGGNSLRIYSKVDSGGDLVIGGNHWGVVGSIPYNTGDLLVPLEDFRKKWTSRQGYNSDIHFVNTGSGGRVFAERELNPTHVDYIGWQPPIVIVQHSSDVIEMYLKGYVPAAGYEINSITVPDAAKPTTNITYGAIAGISEERRKDVQNRVAEIEKDLSPLTAPGSLHDGNLLFFGDSITAGTGATSTNQYTRIASSLLGMVEVERGTPGAAMCSINTTEESPQSEGSFVQAILNSASAVASSRFIVVFYGTNDWNLETPLGAWGDLANTTFYGAMSKGYELILSYNPTARVAFCLPTWRSNDGTKNDIGLVLQDYRDAITDFCQKKNLPYFDLSKIGLNAQTSATFMTDGLHPNVDGHQLLGEYIAAFIKGPGLSTDNALKAVNNLAVEVRSERVIGLNTALSPKGLTLPAKGNVVVASDGLDLAIWRRRGPGTLSEMIVQDAQGIYWERVFYSDYAPVLDFNSLTTGAELDLNRPEYARDGFRGRLVQVKEVPVNGDKFLQNGPLSANIPLASEASGSNRVYWTSFVSTENSPEGLRMTLKFDALPRRIYQRFWDGSAWGEWLLINGEFDGYKDGDVRYANDAPVAIIGDSITANDAYYMPVNDLLNGVQFANLAFGGACVSAAALDSSLTAYEPRRDASFSRAYETAANVAPLTDAPCIVVFQGTNDWDNDAPMGTIDDATEETFYGSLEVGYKGVAALNPDARWVFIAPLWRKEEATGTVNAQGHTLQDYRDAIAAFCAKYNLKFVNPVPLLGVNGFNQDVYLDSSNVHPTAAMRERIGRLVTEAIVGK